jgi:glucoamylase
MSALEGWIERQHGVSAARLLETISSSVVKRREHFFQTIIPARGSVVASTQLAAYDPDPDYFFHWYRDAAIVMDSLYLLHRDGTVADGPSRFADFVLFNTGLAKLDGRETTLPPAMPGFEKFLRRDLAAAHGKAISAETRVNPDGTLDITDWPRPQHDGPALRALTILRWLESAPFAEAEALLRDDLAIVLAHARWPCLDIWEEEQGSHYYTLLVSARALEAGADWLEIREKHFADECRAESRHLLGMLEEHWRGAHFGSRQLASGDLSSRDLDIAVILAAIHGGGDGAHSVHDPRLMATLDQLADLFDGAYAINHNRPPGTAPAMGRYPGDTYYSGGAWYIATLGAAEFCYRAGQETRGDAFLETVRRFTPADGALSEQFDQTSGAQTSAKNLGWSHAAFITCAAARRVAYSGR